MLINGANGIEVLQNLADKYLMHSYLFNDNGVKTLYCGLLYGRKRKTVKYVLNKNTINIENLKYQIKGDTTYKVEVINHFIVFGKKICFWRYTWRRIENLCAG